MRRRVEAEHGTTDIWNLKYVRGGLMDFEFICQYLQLAYAAECPDVLHQNTAQAMQALKRQDCLPKPLADRLIDAATFLNKVQGALRIYFGDNFSPDTTPAGARKALAVACGAASFEALEAALRTHRRNPCSTPMPISSRTRPTITKPKISIPSPSRKETRFE